MYKLWRAIRGFFVGVAAVALYLAMVAGRFVWRAGKLLVFLAVLYGAGTEILKYFPSDWSQVPLTPDGVSWAINTTFDAAERGAWLWVAVAFVFLRTCLNTKPIETMDRYIGSLVLATVALANYLEIEVETDETNTLREKSGALKLIEQGFSKQILSLFIDVPDWRYYARPVRGGTRIRFWDDLRKEIAKARDGQAA